MHFCINCYALNLCTAKEPSAKRIVFGSGDDLEDDFVENEDEGSKRPRQKSSQCDLPQKSAIKRVKSLPKVVTFLRWWCIRGSDDAVISESIFVQVKKRGNTPMISHPPQQLHRMHLLPWVSCTWAIFNTKPLHLQKGPWWCLRLQFGHAYQAVSQAKMVQPCTTAKMQSLHLYYH
jgi:hypothetical protein